MSKDFEEVLRKMADESEIEVPEGLRNKVNITCRSIKRKGGTMKKRIVAAAAIMTCVIIAGVCFPTYAKEIPGVKQVIEILSEKFEINRYDNGVKEEVKPSLFTTKVDGYTIDIQEIYYDGTDFSVFYKVVGDEKLDTTKDYCVFLDFVSDKDSETVILGQDFTEFIDDKTYIAMKSYRTVDKDSGEKAISNSLEIFQGKAVVKGLMVDGSLTETFNDEEVEKNQIFNIKDGEIPLNLDAKDTFVKEYDIKKTINEGNLAMHINKVTERKTGLIINTDNKSFDPALRGDFEVWDSKKGILSCMEANSLENGTLDVRYETASEEGEVYIIPYIIGMKFDGGCDYDRRLVEKGKSYDFGKYGTTEVKDIKIEGDRIYITARTTGYQNLYGFELVNKIGDKSFSPLYVKDKKINGMLDMEATYVYANVNDGKDFYIQNKKQDEDPTFEIKTNEAIKVK